MRQIGLSFFYAGRHSCVCKRFVFICYFSNIKIYFVNSPKITKVRYDMPYVMMGG